MTCSFQRLILSPNVVLNYSCKFLLFGFCGYLFLGSSQAVSGDFLKFKEALDALKAPPPRPSVSMVASGFGASKGDVFAAVSYSDQDLQTNVGGDEDGSIILGFGYEVENSPFKAEFSFGITSVSTSWWGDGKFADEGNVNLKLHKAITPISMGSVASLSFGASNIIGWGGTREMPTNKFISYSEVIGFGTFDQYRVAYTMGYGTAVGQGETSGELFGGVALAQSSLSTSISFIGDEFYLSGTYYPAALKYIAVTYTRGDVFNNHNSSRNILTIGISKRFDN